MSDRAILILLGSLTAIFAIGAVLSKWLDHRRQLAALIARPCPDCGRIYGCETLRTLTTVRYQWILLRGNTAATLGAPRSTFLVTCPECQAETEFKDSDRIFFHPQTGVQSFTRTIKVKKSAWNQPVTPPAGKMNRPPNASCARHEC